MKIEINENDYIECDIQYGKRKKILISIDEVGFITVKAPNNTNIEEIVKVVKQNGNKILTKVDEILKNGERYYHKSYDEEGKFFHLGKEYSLDQLIEIGDLGEEELKENLKKFYIASCKDVIGKRIKIYQEILGVKPKVVEIDESKSRWGSCNTSKKLTFNYRLVMAPMEAIDYVVVHELCHLIHMNHDRSFWRRVGSVLPDYKEKQKFLNIYGRYMTL